MWMLCLQVGRFGPRGLRRPALRLSRCVVEFIASPTLLILLLSMLSEIERVMPSIGGIYKISSSGGVSIWLPIAQSHILRSRMGERPPSDLNGLVDKLASETGYGPVRPGLITGHSQLSSRSAPIVCLLTTLSNSPNLEAVGDETLKCLAVPVCPTCTPVSTVLIAYGEDVQPRNVSAVTVGPPQEQPDVTSILHLSRKANEPPPAHNGGIFSMQTSEQSKDIDQTAIMLDGGDHASSLEQPSVLSYPLPEQAPFGASSSLSAIPYPNAPTLQGCACDPLMPTHESTRTTTTEASLATGADLLEHVAGVVTRHIPTPEQLDQSDHATGDDRHLHTTPPWDKIPQYILAISYVCSRAVSDIWARSDGQGGYSVTEHRLVQWKQVMEQKQLAWVTQMSNDKHFCNKVMDEVVVSFCRVLG